MSMRKEGRKKERDKDGVSPLQILHELKKDLQVVRSNSGKKKFAKSTITVLATLCSVRMRPHSHEMWACVPMKNFTGKSHFVSEVTAILFDALDVELFHTMPKIDELILTFLDDISRRFPWAILENDILTKLIDEATAKISRKRIGYLGGWRKFLSLLEETQKVAKVTDERLKTQIEKQKCYECDEMGMLTKTVSLDVFAYVIFAFLEGFDVVNSVIFVCNVFYEAGWESAKCRMIGYLTSERDYERFIRRKPCDKFLSKMIKISFFHADQFVLRFLDKLRQWKYVKTLAECGKKCQLQPCVDAIFRKLGTDDVFAPLVENLISKVSPDVLASCVRVALGNGCKKLMKIFTDDDRVGVLQIDKSQFIVLRNSSPSDVHLVDKVDTDDLFRYYPRFSSKILLLEFLEKKVRDKRFVISPETLTYVFYFCNETVDDQIALFERLSPYCEENYCASLFADCCSKRFCDMFPWEITCKYEKIFTPEDEDEPNIRLLQYLLKKFSSELDNQVNLKNRLLECIDNGICGVYSVLREKVQTTESLKIELKEKVWEIVEKRGYASERMVGAIIKGEDYLSFGMNDNELLKIIVEKKHTPLLNTAFKIEPNLDFFSVFLDCVKKNWQRGTAIVLSYYYPPKTRWNEVIEFICSQEDCFFKWHLQSFKLLFISSDSAIDPTIQNCRMLKVLHDGSRILEECFASKKIRELLTSDLDLIEGLFNAYADSRKGGLMNIVFKYFHQFLQLENIFEHIFHMSFVENERWMIYSSTFTDFITSERVVKKNRKFEKQINQLFQTYRDRFNGDEMKLLAKSHKLVIPETQRSTKTLIHLAKENHSKISLATSFGICTFHATGKEFEMQRCFGCNDCGGDSIAESNGSSALCEPCKLKCHGKHKTHSHGFGKMYCDCNFDFGTPCKAGHYILGE